MSQYCNIQNIAIEDKINKKQKIIELFEQFISDKNINNVKNIIYTSI